MADNLLNAVNRGVYISDNLPFLKGLNDGCIDLVCIDPPFAKNETFGRKNSKSPDPLKPPLSDEERATELALLKRWGINSPADATAKGIDWPETAYKDFWSWERDVHEEWLRDIEDDYPAIAKLIDVTRDIHGDGTAAYLCYMAVRLLEIKRVLTDTGSLYLHCDHTAGAYLRQLLDAVFGNGENGKPGFRNEITWKRQNSNNSSKRRYGNITDTILFYTKAEEATWHQPYYKQRSEVELRRYKCDKSGRLYKTNDLTAPGADPARMFEWRGTRPSRNWAHSREKLEKLYAEGRILMGRNGKPRLDGHIQYLDEMPPGGKVQTLWDDIPRIPNTATERTGYPTQKPVALAERIIKASCPEDGVVLDCFAGCAYVAIAAERLGRNWVACDINARAWTIFKRQFSKPKLVSLQCAEPAHNLQPALIGNVVTVHGPGELPTPTAPTAELTVPTLKVRDKPRQFKTPASIIPEDEMLDILLNLSGHMAWCCGFANRMADGQVVPTARNFHLDHLNPVSKEGTSHQIVNRAPLCPYHNIKKSNHRLHLAEYRKAIQQAGELMVNDLSELIQLDYAAQRALDIYASRKTQAPNPSMSPNPQRVMLPQPRGSRATATAARAQIIARAGRWLISNCDTTRLTHRWRLPNACPDLAPALGVAHSRGRQALRDQVLAAAG